MGFRFRKSIPIGKHFRINLSKSGVGYSWGSKRRTVHQNRQWQKQNYVERARNRHLLHDRIQGTHIQGKTV